MRKPDTPEQDEGKKKPAENLTTIQRFSEREINSLEASLAREISNGRYKQVPRKNKFNIIVDSSKT